MNGNVFDSLDESSSSSHHRLSRQDDSGASVDAVSFHRPDISRLFRTPLGQNGGRQFKRRRIGRKQEVPAQEFFTPLPDNVIELVFNYLNKRDLVAAMGTCRKLYDVGTRPRYWTFANISTKFITQGSLHLLLDRRIETLRLNASTIYTEKQVTLGYRTLQSTPAELAYLDAGQVEYSDGSILFHLMERCSKLVGLSLERCDCLDDSICEEIAKNTKLRYLDLSMVRGLTANGIGMILGNCQKLEELNLGWAHHTNEMLQVVFASLPTSLKKLNLSGTRELEAMNDDGVAMICNRCPRLEELDLSDAVDLTEAAVAIIRDSLNRLRVLTLARCHGIEPVEFLTLNRLSELNVHGCLAEESVGVLQQRLPTVAINKSFLSTIAHPTNGVSVSSIWGQRTRDWY